MNNIASPQTDRFASFYLASAIKFRTDEDNWRVALRSETSRAVINAAVNAPTLKCEPSRYKYYLEYLTKHQLQY